MKPYRFFHALYARLSRFAAQLLLQFSARISAMVSHLMPIAIDPVRWARGCARQLFARLASAKNTVCPELATTVFNYAHEGIMVADRFGQVLRVNQAFTRITGYSETEVQGRNLTSQGKVRQVEAFCTSMRYALVHQGHWSGDVWSAHKDGSELVIKLSVSVERGRAGAIRHYVAMLSDITQVKKRQQVLEREAHYDALTQLPNRKLLVQRMGQAIADAKVRQQRLAVAFIDLDGFKFINDNYGHRLGDRVLKVLAQRIEATTRKHDTLARLGGDEFVAGLTGLQRPQDCEWVLKQMLKAANAPICIDGRTVQVSASIGVAFFPEHGQEIHELIGKADQAMYLSKRSGGDRLVFCAA